VLNLAARTESTATAATAITGNLFHLLHRSSTYRSQQLYAFGIQHQAGGGALALMAGGIIIDFHPLPSSTLLPPPFYPLSSGGEAITFGVCDLDLCLW
jgi:hypothetical protein